MKKISGNSGTTVKALTLIVGLSSMVLISGMVGCAGDRYTQSTGEHIDDSSDSSRVKKALSADTQYKYEDVEVKTFKGVVQLSGFVNTRDQRSRAGDIAKRVEGVKDVENNITIKESSK